MQNKRGHDIDAWTNQGQLKLRSRTSDLPSEPIPVGEVVEGNEDSDWAAWEDSVAFQDSQDSQNFSHSEAGALGHNSSRTAPNDDDPFSSVNRNSS